MKIKRIFSILLIASICVCLFFTFGFEGEIEYENEFSESQIDTAKNDISAKLGEIVDKLIEFRDMLMAAKGAVDPSDL